MKYRKKPIIVEAVQFTGNNESEIRDFCTITIENGMKSRFVTYEHPLLSEPCIQIHTLEGVMTAQTGDWIIKGVKGEVYPCKPDIFEQTYERIE